MRDYYKGKEKKIQEVCQLYQHGLPSQEIAQTVGIHQQTVLRYIHMSKLRVRRPDRYWKPEKIQRTIRLYKKGLTLRQVASRVGGKYETVSRHLRNNGIPLRSKSYTFSGRKNPAWKNGRRRLKGYIYIYSPNHPYRTKHNQVSEHRLVMERKLGRYLLPTEVVDHINGITDDNHPENLRLFPSNAAHLKATLKGRCPKWTEQGLEVLRRIRFGGPDGAPPDNRSRQKYGALRSR